MVTTAGASNRQPDCSVPLVNVGRTSSREPPTCISPAVVNVIVAVSKKPGVSVPVSKVDDTNAPTAICWRCGDEAATYLDSYASVGAAGPFAIMGQDLDDPLVRTSVVISAWHNVISSIWAFGKNASPPVLTRERILSGDQMACMRFG